jgi:cold shock CspA family protein
MDLNGRFAGAIIKIGPKFGFLKPDESNAEVFFHPDLCDGIDFGNLKVGDRLRFQIKESKRHPGKLCAGRITREPKF